MTSHLHHEYFVDVRDDVTLCVETFGDREDTPVLLVCGLGAQLLTWPQGLCELMADAGHFVIRFDNRDVGKSTRLAGQSVPSPHALTDKIKEGIDIQVPYLLKDMADDAALVLDHFGIDSAHVLGCSMGGMIAQDFAIHHANRTRSLTSIMSTTSRPGLPPPRQHALAALLIPPATSPDEVLGRAMLVMRTIGSTEEHFDEEMVSELALEAFDRADSCPDAFARQFAAILASGSRREALMELKVKALVLHGSADPLIPVECGEDTADAIAGSEYVVVEGMGHDLPRKFWAQYMDAFQRVWAKGERQYRWRRDFGRAA